MRPRRFRATVDFAVQREVVFDYLGDPRNRPEWQSSLLSVTLADRDAEPHLGMAWRETTMVGVRPRMEITRFERPEVWAEVGTWLGIAATLVLTFEERAAGCRVVAEGEISGRHAYAAPAALAGRLAGLAIGADLRKAARILDRRS
ncbi:SRPBCC family protein [Nocardioides allogilvus]|uniref:SRPBCC family protein n=1 Tax=Nocardioides allogilvus TaxID=2072017 RepID=UPI000D2FFB59|nr:SRPBCC family protein [Nocardioides allogilvus]